ncbi:hypothetical protein K2X85_14895 [bacterium]|nr:hypothetical protein [bacterium]
MSTEQRAGAAWFASEQADAVWQQSSLTPFGPATAIVHSCHDKAFAWQRREGDDPLGELTRVFEPAELADPDIFIEQANKAIGNWPAWAKRDWTLKPRFGSSGRGRVAGTDHTIDTSIIRRSLPRLTQQGGLLLEPFCRERTDLSVQLFIPAQTDQAIDVVGSLEGIVTKSGSYLGHRGIVRNKQAYADHPMEELLHQQAISLASHARQAGFWGPCGMDAFVYSHEGKDRLHICEFNARWTVGHVVHGLLRRCRRLNGETWSTLRNGFEFRLDLPEGATHPGQIPLTMVGSRVTSAIFPRHVHTGKSG